jgi:hypothetical protein
MIGITRKLNLWVFHIIGVLICVTNLYFGWYEDYAGYSNSEEPRLISNFALMLALAYSSLLWSRERSNYGYLVIFAQLVLIVIFNPIFPFPETQLKIALILTIPVLLAAIRYREVILLTGSIASPITSTEKARQGEPGNIHLPDQPGVVAAEWIQWTAGPRVFWNTIFLIMMLLFWGFIIHDTRRSLYFDDHGVVTLFMKFYIVLFLSIATLKIGSMFGENTLRYTRMIGFLVFAPLFFLGSGMSYGEIPNIVTVGLMTATELTGFNVIATSERRFFQSDKKKWVTIVIQTCVLLSALFGAFIIASVGLYSR